MIFYIPRITRMRQKQFLERIKSDEFTLNLGCGELSLQKYFPNVINCDLKRTSVTQIVSSASSLPFKSNSIPQIVCIEMLEHIINPQHIAEEIYRVLKPGGKLILTTRFIYPIHDAPHDYYRFTIYGLKEIFKKFIHLKIEPEYSTQKTLAVVIQRLGYQTRTKIFPRIYLSIIHVLSFIILKFPEIISLEYDSINHKKLIPHILSSGYYLTAIKPKSIHAS